MDWNYLFTIPSFIIGLLAGFQGIYETYDEDPFRALFTIPGTFYLLTRGIVPAVVYLLLYGLHLMPHPLWFWSLVCGTAGTELILRTRIFVKEDRSIEGNPRELMYGPLDLLQKYQNLFLESIRKHLPTYRGEDLLQRVKRTVPENMKFVEMCERIRQNRHIYRPKQTIFYKIRNYIYKPKREIYQAIEQGVSECLADYHEKVKAGQPTPKLEESSKRKLGYIIMDLPRVGERGLKLLIS